MSSPSRTVTSLGTSVNVAGGGGRERRDHLRGGGLGQPEARQSVPGSLALCFPPTRFMRGPGASKVRWSSCRAAAETGYGCRLLPSGSGGAAGIAYASPRRRAALRESGWGTPTPAPRKPPFRSRSPGPASSDPGADAAAAATLRCSPPPTPLGPGCTPGLLETVKPSPSLPSPPPRRLGGLVPAAWQGPPRTSRGSKVPALTVGHEEQQGVQQQRRQVSEGTEPVPLFHLPRGARRRRGPGRGEAAAVAAAWAQILLGLRLGRLRTCHGPARRPLPRLPAAANQPRSLAALPSAAPAGGAAPGAQNARSRREATGNRSVPLSIRPSTGRWGTAVQSLPGGPGRGWAAPGPIPGQGRERLGAASFCLLVSFWFDS